jgi:hypothetical protein
MREANMWGWIGRIGEVVKDWWERLTGRGRDEDEEEEEEEEEEEDEEDEEDEEEEEEDGRAEEEQDDDEEREEEDAEEEVEDGEAFEEADDDYSTLLEMLRDVENDIDENAEYLTNAELARTDDLLAQLYELLAEYETLDADDRAALIDLALELLDELERIVMHAALRADDNSCSDRRGPFATKEEAKTYAEELPVPSWIYTDGLGWWWVCIEYATQTA